MTEFIEYKGADFSKYTLDASDIHDETGKTDTDELASTISGKQSTPEHVIVDNNDLRGSDPKITVSEDIQTSVLVTDSGRDDGDDHLIESFLKTHGDSSAVFVFNTQDKEMEVFHGSRITSISDDNSSNINADLNSYFDAGDTEALVTRGVSDYNEVRIANKDQLATNQLTPSMVNEASDTSDIIAFGGLFTATVLAVCLLYFVGLMVKGFDKWTYSKQIKKALTQYELESKPGNVENIALCDAIYDTDFLNANEKLDDATIKKLIAYNFTTNLMNDKQVFRIAMKEGPYSSGYYATPFAYIKKEIL